VLGFLEMMSGGRTVLDVFHDQTIFVKEPCLPSFWCRLNRLKLFRAVLPRAESAKMCPAAGIRLDFSSRKIQLPKCRIGYTYADSALSNGIAESNDSMATVSRVLSKGARLSDGPATMSTDSCREVTVARVSPVSG